MVIQPSLDSAGELPLYRQLGGYLHDKIKIGELRPGDRLPPTRDLAGQLGLNRTTVSAAYDLLQADGLIESRGGRGSFVRDLSLPVPPSGALWQRALRPSVVRPSLPPAAGVIDFTTSRPSANLFPLDEFRVVGGDVLQSPELGRSAATRLASGLRTSAATLVARCHSGRSGSPRRRHPDHQRLSAGGRSAAPRAGASRAIALLIEEPVYPGLRNSFQEAARNSSASRWTRRARSGCARSCHARREIARGDAVVPESNRRHHPRRRTGPSCCAWRSAHGVVVIENDIYAELRYSGPKLPPL